MASVIYGVKTICETNNNVLVKKNCLGHEGFYIQYLIFKEHANDDLRVCVTLFLPPVTHF